MLRQMTPYQQKKVNEYFTAVKKGDFIYAGQIKSRFAVSIEEAYQFLEALRKDGFLVNMYEIYCHDCDRSTGKFLDSLEEFRAETYCEVCDRLLTLEENVIVLYKVVRV